MGVADTFGEAFAKAQIAAGQKLPVKGTVFLSVNDHDKPVAVAAGAEICRDGIQTGRDAWNGRGAGESRIAVERVYKVKEGRPNVVDLIKGDRIQLIINTPRGQDTFFDEKAIRRAAVTQRIPTITTAWRCTRRSRRNCCPAATGNLGECAPESACVEDHRGRLAKGVQANSTNHVAPM